VQPDNARFFLDREKDGLPQRFLWLPVRDPYALEVQPKPVAPQQLRLPTFGGARHELVIPDEVGQEIWFRHYQVNTAVEGIDPLDAHLKLTQLKVAAALAFLAGRPNVELDDWKTASHLIDVSNKVRASLRSAVAAQRSRENKAVATDQAERELIILDRLTERNEKRVAHAIIRKLEMVRTATRRELRLGMQDEHPGGFRPGG
jgi:hypothetical protein